MGQCFVTEGPLIQGHNLFSRRVGAASIYLFCTSRVCSKSTNVSEDQQYNTQGSFKHLTIFLGQFIGVIWMTDFWCSTAIRLSKAISFHFKAPCLLFPHSDEQMTTHQWCSRDSLPASATCTEQTPADAQGLYQRIPKQCSSFTVFRK